jgi:hypothetical protein
MGACQPYYQNTNICLDPVANKFRDSLIAAGTAFSFTMDFTFYSWGVMGRNGYPVEAWGFNGEQGSYGINGWMYNPPANNGPEDAEYYRKINAPGNLAYAPLFSDCMWDGGRPDPTDPPPTQLGWQTQNFDMSIYTLARHTGMQPINMCFLDTSVRNVGLRECWTLSWNSQWPTVNTVRFPNWMNAYR